VHARVTFQGLWVEADDDGRGVADALVLKGSIWPLDRDITEEDVEKHLHELADTGHVTLYEVAGDRYYEVTTWEKHQAAAYRRGRPIYPPPPPGLSARVQESATTCREVLEGNKEKGTGREEGASAGAEDFSHFWKLYPRKSEDDGPARRAFLAQYEHRDQIQAGLLTWMEFWEKDCTDRRFVPYPENFLTKRKWLERPGEVTSRDGPAEPVLARIVPQGDIFEEAETIDGRLYVRRNHLKPTREHA
jgi:hypothetical protein